MSNTVKSDEAEVYENQIMMITDSYINGLDDPQNIQKAMVFRGLLQTIYETLFRPAKNMPNNRGTLIDIENIDLLNALWRIFTRLCYANNHIPSIKRFCLMIGLSPQTCANWGSQATRASSQHFESYKNWLFEVESALEDQTSEHGAIGTIFNLKCNFGWREAAPLPAEEYTAIPQSTVEEIRERYRDATKPELPDLGELTE